jgi:hypothetical protein
MAIIPGSVRLTGFIAPTDSNDTYPVTRPEWGLGGLRTVGNLALRDSITSQRREAGMLVYVISDDNYYKLETGLTNSDWVVVNFGTGATSASTSSFSGLTDVNIDTGTTGNEFYYLTYSAGTAYNIEEFTYNLIVTSSGQTSFTLPAPPIEISKTKFFINGVKQNFNNQYNITGGTSLILDNSYDWSWISTDDILEINYLHL